MRSKALGGAGSFGRAAEVSVAGSARGQGVLVAGSRATLASGIVDASTGGASCLITRSALATRTS